MRSPPLVYRWGMTNDLSGLMLRAQDEDPLRALRATSELRGEIERMEAVQVRRARIAGLSWAQIADAIGVSKQAAHRKYGRS
ncbi:sigma factor-like helix-turn-helix DNA-binding protein [Nonomuraea longicatena]|uniref:Sigma factor-like helix-turn-helix DNA-binding protein n=2 Tax=Nonomuraea longicatena TaxID=83682 RepID=A0ABP3ZBZ9_9ACTN